MRFKSILLLFSFAAISGLQTMEKKESKQEETKARYVIELNKANYPGPISCYLDQTGQNVITEKIVGSKLIIASCNAKTKEQYYPIEYPVSEKQKILVAHRYRWKDTLCCVTSPEENSCEGLPQEKTFTHRFINSKGKNVFNNIIRTYDTNKTVTIYDPRVIEFPSSMPSAFPPLYYVFQECISEPKKELQEKCCIYTLTSNSERFAYLASIKSDARSFKGIECGSNKFKLIALYNRRKEYGYQLYAPEQNKFVEAPNIDGFGQSIESVDTHIVAAINRYTLVHNTSDAMVHIYDLESQKTVAQYVGPEDHIIGMACHKKHIAVLSKDGNLYLIDRTSGMCRIIKVDQEMLQEKTNKDYGWSLKASIVWISDDKIAILINTGYYQVIDLKK
jgi:hypothetical protein